MNSPILTSSRASGDSRSRRKAPDSAPLDSAKSNPTPAASSTPDSPGSETLETSESLETLPGLDLSLFAAPDTHASPHPSSESEKATKITAGSGRQLSTLSRLSGPLGLLVKTCLVTSVWASTKCLLTWRASVTPRNRLLFQLAPLMPHTSALASGFWPTLNTQDGNAAKYQNKGGYPQLCYLVKLCPTLNPNDWKKSWKPGQRRRQLTDPAQGIIPAGGSLNPAWAEWLMGYPIGHTELKPLATRSSGKSRKTSSGGSRRLRKGK